ncbi:glutathione S-transferase T3-like [Quercus robur]|uniref:glutathione S-transferase T3-like n=1 Tax=Quercus robur TaxID=38942 RepID=UPI0021627BF1|nr:glutathione S-transferase T3-like [Quercus robur]
MDSQNQNPFFLDILQDNEQGFESFDSSNLMFTPHSDVNVHQSPPQVEMGQSIPPIAKKSTTKRGQRGINFTIDEDIKLVSTWLNISLDVVTSTNQKHTTFWERIWSTFHNDKKFNCTKDSLNSRWSTIQRETNKFCGCLAQIENRNESGKTEHDKIEDAKTMYQINCKNAFQLEHCWRILRNEAKWLILRDSLKARTRQPTTRPATQSFASSINVDEDNEEMNSSETLERPIGKKAEKVKLKKRKNCDDVIPTLSSQLDEIKEEKRRMHEEKKESMCIALEERKEAMRIASEERRELIRIKEEKNEVEKRKMEDELMMKDTRTMDPEQKEYIRLRRLEILERLRSKYAS